MKSAIMGPVLSLKKAVRKKISSQGNESTNRKVSHDEDSNIANNLATDNVATVGERLFSPYAFQNEAARLALEAANFDRYKKELNKPIGNNHTGIVFDFGERTEHRTHERRIERMGNRKVPTTNPNVLEFPDEPEALSMPLLEDIISDVVLENHMRREGILFHSKKSSVGMLILALIIGSMFMVCSVSCFSYFLYREFLSEDVILDERVYQEVLTFKSEGVFSCVKRLFRAVITDYAWSQWVALMCVCFYMGITVPMAWYVRVDIDRTRYGRKKHRKET